MTQAEMKAKLAENPQQAKQFNEVVKILDEAIKKEMPTFRKLVQFDVLAEIQKKAVADGLKNNNAGEKEITDTLDTMLKQIFKDLDAQITQKCKSLK